MFLLLVEETPEKSESLSSCELNKVKKKKKKKNQGSPPIDSTTVETGGSPEVKN
jgi:hypothetical protein